jgi:hypothetical protein
VIADRSCGPCNVCCIVPAINDPALRKAPGCRCHNAQPGGACGIYETRPETCRNFFCGWRRFAWVSDALRPDLSGVYIWLSKDRTLATGAHDAAVVVTLLDERSLAAEGLAGAVIAAIEAGFATYLMIPGPPGHPSCGMFLNEVLNASRRNNKQILLRCLTQLRSRALANMAKAEPSSSMEQGRNLAEALVAP